MKATRRGILGMFAAAPVAAPAIATSAVSGAYRGAPTALPFGNFEPPRIDRYQAARVATNGWDGSPGVNGASIDAKKSWSATFRDSMHRADYRKRQAEYRSYERMFRKMTEAQVIAALRGLGVSESIISDMMEDYS